MKAKNETVPSLRDRSLDSFANDDYRDFRRNEHDHGTATVIGSIPGLVSVLGQVKVFLDK